jgi:hypothetical protein
MSLTTPTLSERSERSVWYSRLVLPSGIFTSGITAMLAPLSRVIVFVGSVQTCAKFFADAFELEYIESEIPGDWQELDAGGCRLAFHQAFNADGSRHTSPTGSEMNPHKIVFYAEDVRAMRETLIGRGAAMGEVVEFGDIVMCDGADPEGHPFQICSR